MKSTAVNTIDFNTWTGKAPKAKSKEGKSAFENEMVESEKRMKRKTKVDGRENATAGQAASARNDHNSKKDSQEAVSEKRSSTPRKSAEPKEGTVANKMKTTNAQEKDSPETLEQAVANAQDMLASANAAEAFTMPSALNDGQGKIDIQGMQMMAPQPMEATPTVDLLALQEMTETPLVAEGVKSTGSADKNLANLLSEGSEQELAGNGLLSDFAAVAPQANKDNQAMGVAFTNMLENKVKDLGEVKKENIDNLITQASAILKDGGGEMKLQLRPEGMGTVDLKVGLQNGEVSIEIMTQDQHVKKMFEDSVFDIRNALEAQHMKIDTFKVGVSEHFDQSMAQQNASQFAEREFARDFMGQFRDDRQAFRNQSIDNMIQNRNPFQKQPEGLQPATMKINNGRLNIIA